MSNNPSDQIIIDISDSTDSFDINSDDDSIEVIVDLTRNEISEENFVDLSIEIDDTDDVIYLDVDKSINNHNSSKSCSSVAVATNTTAGGVMNLKASPKLRNKNNQYQHNSAHNEVVVLKSAPSSTKKQMSKSAILNVSNEVTTIEQNTSIVATPRRIQRSSVSASKQTPNAVVADPSISATTTPNSNESSNSGNKCIKKSPKTRVIIRPNLLVDKSRHNEVVLESTPTSTKKRVSNSTSVTNSNDVTTIAPPATTNATPQRKQQCSVSGSKQTPNVVVADPSTSATTTPNSNESNKSGKKSIKKSPKSRVIIRPSLLIDKIRNIDQTITTNTEHTTPSPLRRSKRTSPLMNNSKVSQQSQLSSNIHDAVEDVINNDNVDNNENESNKTNRAEASQVNNNQAEQITSICAGKDEDEAQKEKLPVQQTLSTPKLVRSDTQKSATNTNTTTRKLRIRKEILVGNSNGKIILSNTDEEFVSSNDDDDDNDVDYDANACSQSSIPIPDKDEPIYNGGEPQKRTSRRANSNKAINNEIVQQRILRPRSNKVDYRLMSSPSTCNSIGNSSTTSPFSKSTPDNMKSLLPVARDIIVPNNCSSICNSSVASRRSNSTPDDIKIHLPVALDIVAQVLGFDTNNKIDGMQSCSSTNGSKNIPLRIDSERYKRKRRECKLALGNTQKEMESKEGNKRRKLDDSTISSTIKLQPTQAKERTLACKSEKHSVVCPQNPLPSHNISEVYDSAINEYSDGDCSVSNGSDCATMTTGTSEFYKNGDYNDNTSISNNCITLNFNASARNSNYKYYHEVDKMIRMHKQQQLLKAPLKTIPSITSKTSDIFLSIGTSFAKQQLTRVINNVPMVAVGESRFFGSRYKKSNKRKSRGTIDSIQWVPLSLNSMSEGCAHSTSYDSIYRPVY